MKIIDTYIVEVDYDFFGETKFRLDKLYRCRKKTTSMSSGGEEVFILEHTNNKGVNREIISKERADKLINK